MGWHFPEDNVKAAPAGTIRMQFSRFLAADTSTTHQGLCVSTGNDACLSIGAAGSAAELAVEYDPVDRVVVLKPQRPLAAGKYKVRVLAPKSDTDETGIRAFDGAPLAQEASFEFTVDPSVMSVEGCPPDAPSPTCEPKRTIDYCTSLGTACYCSNSPASTEGSLVPSVSDYVATCSGNASCHARSTSFSMGRPVGQALLLDDGPDAGGVPAAVARIVRERIVPPETATDPDPSVARTNGPETFGHNMPYIDPKNPGNSYILYKMIIGMLRCPFDEDPSRNPLTDRSYCSPSGTYQGSATSFSYDFYECSSLAGGLCPGANVDASTGVEGGVDVDAGITTPHLLHKTGDLRPYLVEPWVPDADWKAPMAGEYDRLRLRIRGNPMPSPTGAEGPQNVHLISAWIAAGAPVTATCPSPQPAP